MGFFTLMMQRRQHVKAIGRQDGSDVKGECVCVVTCFVNQEAREAAPQSPDSMGIPAEEELRVGDA